MKGEKDSSKEESPIPMLILMTLILLGRILLAGLFIFFRMKKVVEIETYGSLTEKMGKNL